MLQQTANVIRTGDAGSLQYFDGEKVFLHTFEVPDQQEKETLLYATWDSALSALRDNSLKDSHALDRASAIVSGGILYAHPFIDGNERTSRALSYVIAKGTKRPDQLERIVSKSGVQGGWSNAPMGLDWREAKSYRGPQPQTIEWDFAFAGEGEDALGGVLANGFNSDAVLREFIERYGSDISDIIEASTKYNDNGQATLQAQQFIENLVMRDEGGIANAKALLDIKREKSAGVVAGYLSHMVSQAKLPIFQKLQWAIDSFGGRENGRGPAVRKIVGEYMKQHAEEGRLSVPEQQVFFNKLYSVVDLAENGFVEKPKNLG